MSAIKLPIDRTHGAGKFDVIGTSYRPDYIDHVGVLSDACSVGYGKMVGVFEMGPPLSVGQPHSGTKEPVIGSVNAHAVGWIDDLTIEERRDLETWLQDVRTRMPTGAFRYTIDPPFDVIRDRLTKRIIGRKFSCAGFVFCCYKEGLEIELLDIHPNRLPPVDRQTLGLIYDEDRLGEFDLRRARFGLSGDPPWRIVLCGYILHALNRTAEAIRRHPYVVSDIKEAAFP